MRLTSPPPVLGRVLEMETSQAEASQPRSTSVVPELHEHSCQAPSIHPAQRRRPTIESLSLRGRPEYLQAHKMNEAVLNTEPVARDFEQAIIDDDDDKSECGDVIGDRLASTSPAHTRRGTSRRNQAQVNLSRDSSPSSRSTSPANSVQAFADPRRRERANTIGSIIGSSDLDLGVQRTFSGSTHQRRPTFSNASICQLDNHEKGTSFQSPREDEISD